MILLLWVSNASQGPAPYGACRRWEAVTRDPERTFTLWGLFTGHGGTAHAFRCCGCPAVKLSAGEAMACAVWGCGTLWLWLFLPQTEKITGENPFFPKQQHHLLNKNILLFYRVLGEGRGSKVAKFSRQLSI